MRSSDFRCAAIGAAVLLAACSPDHRSPAAPLETPRIEPRFAFSAGAPTDLGTLTGPDGPGATSRAMAISENGSFVTGFSDLDSSGYPHGFRWSAASGLRDVGAIFGYDPGQASQSFGLAVNNSGAVVGYTVGLGTGAQPYVWTPAGGMAFFHQGVSPWGQATDINNSGQIVGIMIAAGGDYHAFRYTPGAGTQDLGTLGGTYSKAWGINDNGDVVGEADNAQGQRRAFRWTAAGGMQELPLLPGGTTGAAYEINDGGQAVGYGTAGSYEPSLALLWGADGSVDSLGVGMARAVNNSGQVVGTDDFWSGAWFWSASTGAFRIGGDMAGWTIDIADNGRIAGQASPPAYYRHATLWGVGNAPEIAGMGGPYSAYEGQQLRFYPTVTDADGDALTYLWDFGDGRFSTGRTPNKQYNDQGDYPVRLIVTDAAGLSDTAVAVAQVRNAAPTGVFSAPFSALEGRTFSLGFSSVNDLGAADRGSLQVSINCGTTFRAYSTSLTGVCTAPPNEDTITIRARVKDKDGGIREYSRVIPVNDAVPSAHLAASTATSIPAGGSVTLDPSFSDSGVLDGPWSWRITWGDGTGTAWTATDTQGALPARSHVYRADGSYAARLWVKDRDGTQGYSAPVTVTVAP